MTSGPPAAEVVARYLEVWGERADAWITERWSDGTTAFDVDRLLAFRVADGRLVECEILETDQHAVDLWLADHPAD